MTELIPTRADVTQISAEIASSGGMREPVVLYEGKVIEGRIRYEASYEAGVQAQFKDWVLIADGEPLDWMVRRHVAQHELTELDAIRLMVSVLPQFRAMKGQTNRLLYTALGGKLSWNKIRALMWLEEAGALEPVLSGEKEVFEAARSLGLAGDKRNIALGKSYGAGDKFDEALLPIKRYLAAWKRKGYLFRHINPKEAQRRLLLIDQLVEELLAARPDLERRSVTATLSAPPERKRKVGS